MPFLIIISVQGGVNPWCEQGSIVTYKSEFLKSLLKFKALNSLCGLPPIEVHPDEITVLSFTTTQPTEGFKDVEPILISAWWNANFKNK